MPSASACPNWQGRRGASPSRRPPSPPASARRYSRCARRRTPNCSSRRLRSTRPASIRSTPVGPAAPTAPGQRMDLAHTRAMVSAAVNSSTEHTEFIKDPVFGLACQKEVEGVPSEVLARSSGIRPDGAGIGGAFRKKFREVQECVRPLPVITARLQRQRNGKTRFGKPLIAAQSRFLVSSVSPTCLASCQLIRFFARKPSVRKTAHRRGQRGGKPPVQTDIAFSIRALTICVAIGCLPYVSLSFQVTRVSCPCPMAFTSREPPTCPIQP